MEQKNKIGILLLILILLPTTASAAWWDTNWSKKIPIQLDNTGNADVLTDYQVNLNITYDSDMNASFDDIRVVNDTSGLTVPYWIESQVNSGYANIWFNAISIPASVWTNSTYYLYYGNPSATSASNGTNTFIRFHGATSAEFLDAAQTSINNIVIEIKGRQNVTASNIWWGVGKTLADNPSDGLTMKQYSNTLYHLTFNNGASTMHYTEGIITTGTYYRMTMKRYASQVDAYLDNVLFMTPITTNLPDEPMGLGMNFYDANGGDQLWSFIRKYASPEPNVLLGVEETSLLTLSGYVNNTLGYHIEGARIDLGNDFTFTDNTGYYEFPNFGAGTYSILVQGIPYNNITSFITLADDTSMNYTLTERTGVTLEDLNTQFNTLFVCILIFTLLPIGIIRRLFKK